MSKFINDIIHEFYINIHSFQENNWDYDMFQTLSNDHTNRQIFIDSYSYYLKFLFQNQENLQQVHEILADSESKNWLTNLLLFRMVGHLHFKLPTNNEQHWRDRQKAKEMIVSESDTDYSGIFGELQKYAVSFEDQYITIDCWWLNVAWTFLFKQYYFNRNNVKICPELGDYVIDAGACFGDTAIAFASTIGSEGKVFSFEIEPHNLDVFCYNLMQNQDLAERVVISDYALTDSSETQLYLHGDGPSANISNTPSEIPIATTTIDQLVYEKSIDRVDFIKMDIEGAELSALHGAVETIRKFRPKLAISIYHRPNDIFDIPIFIHSLDIGYQLYIDHYTIHLGETVLYAKVME
ncbi:FkbM family methyltransferase [Nostoc sp. GT001]|uniref:FkbM family methyltransferase n=1 Tax=Nostoc sp. GT001 TaxID=3056647 RepID=UPI0025AAB0E1|nr:FkbM family methyltransferase [Nostoc sp. GT001]MDM9583773.1 FkbM family methyltransferase [Nostoc sp. GT001]